MRFTVPTVPVHLQENGMVKAGAKNAIRFGDGDGDGDGDGVRVRGLEGERSRKVGGEGRSSQK